MSDGRNLNFVESLRPLHRSLFSLVAGTVVFFCLPAAMPVIVKLLLGWIGFCLTYLIVCWLLFCMMTVEEIKLKAREEDGSKAYVFAFIILASVASFCAVFLLIMDKDKIQPGLLVPVALGGMMLSWLLVHTIYVFHYAHLYYTSGKKEEGLDFPGDGEPDYFDFAYFSFCMGCTFQVSDVEITTKAMRRAALFHSLLAFGLNTFVVALTINIVAGLSN